MSESSLAQADEFKTKLQTVLREIQQKWETCPGLILTEADAQAQVYKGLSRDLGECQPSATPGQSAAAIHLEVPWLNKNGSLRIRPDITVLDTTQLLLEKGQGPIVIRAGETGHFSLRGKWLHKQFWFVGRAFIVEIKLFRSKLPNAKELSGIRKDIKNMRFLINLNGMPKESGPWGYLLIFSRFPQKNRLIESFKKRLDRFKEIGAAYLEPGKIAFFEGPMLGHD